MSDAVAIALITAAVQIAIAAPGIIVGLVTLFKVREVQKSTNGLTTALVKTTADAAKLQGREEQRIESIIHPPQ